MTTQMDDAWTAMEDIDLEIDAAELLVDLVDDMVMEDSERTERMDKKFQGQLIVLFDTIRARLKKAEAHNEVLRDCFKAREVVANLAPTPEDLASATETVRSQRLTRQPVAAKVARRSRKAVSK